MQPHNLYFFITGGIGSEDLVQVVGNKARGRISKRLFEENKARQVFRKTNISYSLVHTRTYAYQGVKNIRFWKICDFSPCIFT